MAYPKTKTRKMLFGGTVTKTKRRTPTGKTATKVRRKPLRAKKIAKAKIAPRLSIGRIASPPLKTKTTTIVRTKKITPKVKVVKTRPARGKKGRVGLLRYKPVKVLSPRKVKRKRIKY